MKTPYELLHDRYDRTEVIGYAASLLTLREVTSEFEVGYRMDTGVAGQVLSAREVRYRMVGHLLNGKLPQFFKMALNRSDGNPMQPHAHIMMRESGLGTPHGQLASLYVSERSKKSDRLFAATGFDDHKPLIDEMIATYAPYMKKQVPENLHGIEAAVRETQLGAAMWADENLNNNSTLPTVNLPD